jgi:hypothetical protein
MRPRNPKSESAVRNTAKRNGLVLRKAHIRHKAVAWYGTYGITDISTNALVFGDGKMGGFGKSLEECARYVAEIERSYKQRDLFKRGWTRTMIRDWLVQPDETIGRGAGGGYVYLYRASKVEKIESQEAWQQCRAKWKQRRKSQAEPQPVDLLRAVFAVNRSAKRYRDAAQSCYRSGKHGLAGWNRERKEKLYELKDRGIVEAVRLGRIQPRCCRGSLVEYRGEEYCFHSRLIAKNLDVSSLPFVQGELSVDAKPKTAAEERLRDAVLTLESLPQVGDDFVPLSYLLDDGKDDESFRKGDNLNDWDHDDSDGQ